jgi:DNA-binding NarL/FixJ family response regulator
MDAVSKGEYFMDSSVSRKMVEQLIEPNKIKKIKTQDIGYEKLTTREQEILALLAEGLSNRQISERLFISTKTVENHRSNIMNKINIHNRHELIRYAVKIGLIDIDLWQS